MPMIDVPVFSYPDMAFGPGIVGALAFDAADEKVAAIMRIPKTGTISKVGFATRTVTTGATVDVRLETVSTTSAAPTGTLWGANTNAPCVIDSADDNTWFQVALTAGASVAKGDVIALVVANSNSSPGNMQFASSGYIYGGSGSPPAFAHPYTTTLFQPGGWQSSGTTPVALLEYDDGTFGEMPGVYPLSGLHTAALSSNTTPDEYAMRVVLPFSARVRGAWASWQSFLGVEFDLVLYDGTTAIASSSFDPDQKYANSRAVLLEFPNSVELSADTLYRLAIKPTTTSSGTITLITVDDPAYWAAMPGGVGWYGSERTDGGAWTDTDTRRITAGLLIDGIAAGGGGFRHRGIMSGGALSL